MDTTTTTTTTTNVPPNKLDALRIGDGATECGYSDRHAGTVIARTPATITLQLDKATLLNGYNSGEPDALSFTPGGFFGHTAGVQRYAYERDPDGTTLVFRRRKNGQYMNNGSRLVPGRNHYYDFNF